MCCTVKPGAHGGGGVGVSFSVGVFFNSGRKSYAILFPFSYEQSEWAS